jgi:hypothetical protein
MTDIVERLELEGGALLSEGAAEIVRLRAERDRLREALYPFAEAVDSLDEDHPDHYAISKSPAAMGINGGDLRKARAAFKETGHE